MRKYITLSLLLLSGVRIFAQQYCFDSVPDELKKHARAIVRSEQCLFTITGYNKAVEKVKMVITIVNEKADEYSKAEVYYDDFSKINYLRGAIYDDAGNLIKTLGLSDVKDGSVISAAAFYSDDRVKRMTPEKYKYPYTFEYEYEKEYSSLMQYPTWLFQSDYGVSVERSGIQFIVSNGVDFRYYARNLINPVDSIVQDERKIYTWQEENLKAIVQNYINISYSSLNFPVLYTAPSQFEYGGIKGSMDSWSTFGKWNYDLIQGQDKLSTDETSVIAELVKMASDPKDKIKILYEYMQSRTRYVSVQLGIGGWRPASAESVSKNGFGDCKGLVNYMKVILKTAGIESFYTLVSAGENNETDINFISASFNHAILCVPVQKDTIWLECTDSNLPFNYLGTFTDDRYALLVTALGGVMVKTPKFSKDENIFNRRGEVTLYETGSTLLNLTNNYSGSFYDIASFSFSKKSVSEMRRILDQGIRFYNFNVNSVSYSENKNERPSAQFIFSLSVNDLTTKMQNRIFFNPTIDKSPFLGDIQPASILIKRTEIRYDSISFYLPLGFKLDYIPEDVNLTSEFGQYTYKIEIGAGKFLFKRYFELNEGKIEEDKLEQFKNFMDAVARSDRRILILSKAIISSPA